MPLRRDEIDLTEQRARQKEASEELARVLGDIAAEAKSLAKTAARGKPVDLVPMHALHRDLVRAEEQCDLAYLDLQTASGEDA